MKRVLDYPFVLITSALMASLAGCSNHTDCSPSCPTTQPVCTQPARDTLCKVAEEPVCVEVVEAEEIVCEVESPFCGQKRSTMSKQFDRQVYNAELADMSLADVHFLPHRTGLNATGTQKLNHLAWLADNYGGTIKLDLKDPASKLAQARVDTVKAYLNCWGLPADKIKVEIGLSEQEGMNAREAIEIYNDTRYKKSGQ
jgi:hypothetical protein